MQASFYNYGSATSASNQSNDTIDDQGTWQQPDPVQNTSLQQDSVYYTGVISGAPQSYFTDNASGNSSAMGGIYARGAKANSSKSPKFASGNVDMSQTQSNAQFGNTVTQFMASNQFQDNAIGPFNNNSTEAGFYGYSGDQYITNSGNGIMSNNYNNMGLIMGDNNERTTMVNTSMGMGSNSGMGNNSSGGTTMENSGDNMGINSMGMGNSGNGQNLSLVNNAGYKGGGMYMGPGRNYDDPRGHNLGMTGNMVNTSHSYNNDYDSYNNDFYVYGNNNPNHGNYRGRGNRFQNQPRNSNPSSRGHVNNMSHGDWKSGYRNKFGPDLYRRGGRLFNSSAHHHDKEMSRGSYGYHSNYMGGKGFAGGDKSITIHLNAAYYNKWCYLRKHYNKRDNDLAEHLLDIHDKQCNGCKEKNEIKKPARKRKVSDGKEETTTTNESEEELTEEEMQMKKLMGFAGFKSTKGSKPKDTSFSTVDCTKNSKDVERQESVTSSSLTPEERKAMAHLGGFSVFTKGDADNAAPVGFGAPAVNFTSMSDSELSSTNS